MIRPRQRFCVSICLAVITWSIPVFATDERENLELVRSRIAQMEDRLEKVRGREEDAAEERERLQLELRLAEARVDAAHLTLAQRRDDLVILKSDLRRLNDELGRRSGMLRASVQMAALLGQPGPLRLLSDAALNGSIDEALDTVTALVEGQARLREEQRTLRLEKRGKLESLSRGLDAARREALSLRQRREELTKLSAKVDKRLAELQREEQSTRRELDDLNQRAEALEALLGRLASKSRAVMESDIRRFRGALGWPVEGRVEVTFGKHRTAQYATYTVCNGVRISVEPGQEVRSVFGGEVAYARFFKGYGNMVVIDHGREIYTVTAGLATLFVRTGERVGLQDPLGLAGPERGDGNVYLEFRSGRRALDPLDWLRLREGAP